MIYLSKTNSISTKPIIFFSFQTDFTKYSEEIEKIINTTLDFLKNQDPQTFEKLELHKARNKGDGAVNINAAIIKKIKQATLFIGDITLVGKYIRQDKTEKYYINTNVCVETGYALSTILPQHIIVACMGDASDGSIKYGIKDNQVPFDLSDIHTVFGKNKEEFCKKLINEIIEQLYNIYKIKIDNEEIKQYTDSIYRKSE